MEALRIIGLCVLAAVVYGIAHDQVTARVCIEYFTIGHPRIFETESPTLLAIGWGVVASWWVGLLLGAPLAFAAIRGQRPRRSARSLVRPVAKLLVCMGGTALVAGVIGFALANAGLVFLVEPLASRVPGDRHVVFIADLWAHSASYLTGFVGGIVLINRVWRSRKALADDPAQAGARG
ncbi:MAG TPA: hypothetical protein VFD82_24800 [Planctomycetota bacterium]|nr:hypothetical protein [Planctomycetota bacterium]